MKTHLSLISVLTTVTFLIGCKPSEPPLKPLSQAELNTLKRLQQDYEYAKRQKGAYKKEVERINPTFRIKFRNKSLGIMCQVHQ